MRAPLATAPRRRTGLIGGFPKPRWPGLAVSNGRSRRPAFAVDDVVTLSGQYMQPSPVIDAAVKKQHRFERLGETMPGEQTVKRAALLCA